MRADMHGHLDTLDVRAGVVGGAEAARRRLIEPRQDAQIDRRNGVWFGIRKGALG